MFVLTRQEQRAIAFIVLALALGLLTEHYRHEQARKQTVPNELSQPATPPSRSPAPPKQLREPETDE
jgi:hypothetical protein